MLIDKERRYRLPDPQELERDLISVTITETGGVLSWDIYVNSKSVSSMDYPDPQTLQDMAEVLKAAYSDIIEYYGGRA